MACDTMRLPQQTPAERIIEVRKAVSIVADLVAKQRVRVKVGPQGAITFDGIPDADRARMTDACIYRGIMRSGSAAAKLAIQRAEQMAGRTVDRKVVTNGVHSHDGGQTWSRH